MNFNKILITYIYEWNIIDESYWLNLRNRDKDPTASFVDLKI